MGPPTSAPHQGSRKTQGTVPGNLGVGSADDLHDPGRDLRLPGAVVLVEQLLLEAGRVVGGGAHGVHPGGQLAGQRLLQGALDSFTGVAQCHQSTRPTRRQGPLSWRPSE